MRNNRLFVAVFVAVWMGFVAVGKELTGEEVVSTSTTYNEQITGSGSFRITNGAVLTLNDQTSTFTGGVIIDKGKLVTKNTLSKNYPYAGEGTITLNCSGTALSQFYFSSIMRNNVVINGNSTASYPATDQGGGCTLNGTVTANGDFYIGASGYNSRDDSMDSDGKVIFSGAIDATGHKVATSSHTLVKINNTIKCDTLEGYHTVGTTKGNKLGKMGGFKLIKTKNAINHIILDHQTLLMCATASADGATVRFQGQHLPATNGHNSVTTSYIDIFKNTSGSARQKFKWVESDECTRDIVYGYELRCSRTIGAMLELQGEADTEKTAYVAINDGISLYQSAPATFKQIFRDRRNLMSGDINIGGGKFEIAGNATFENVVNVGVTNGEMIVSSTESALDGMRKLVLGENGKFTMSDKSQIADKVVELDLASTSTFAGPSGTTLEFASIKVNGEMKPATTYTHENLPQLAEGTTVKALTGGSSEVTWTGGAGDADSSKAANWGLETAPDFSFEFYHPTFATGGSRAEFAGETWFKGIDFTGDNDFTIGEKENESAEIKLTVNPIAFSSSTAARTFTIEPDLTIGDAVVNQSWQTPPADTVIFDGKVSSAAGTTLSLDNGGTNVFHDLSGFAGTLDVPYTQLLLDGTVGTPENDKYLSLTMNVSGGAMRSRLCVSNAVFNMPFKILCSGMSIEEHFAWMRVGNYSTNVFKKNVYSASSTCLRSSKGAQVVFEGEVRTDNTFHFRGMNGTKAEPSEMWFKDRVTAENSEKGYAYLGAEGAMKIVFEGTGNFCWLGLYFYNAVVDCRVPDQFCRRGSEMRCPLYGDSSATTLQLNRNHEEFSRIKMTGSTISGDYPATLASIGGSYTNSAQKVTSDNLLSGVNINGWVGLEIDIQDDFYFDIKTTTSASYGDVTVKRGTLRFDASSTWLNGTNVVVSGTGKLSLKRASFGEQSVIRFSDSGKLDIADDVVQKCAQAFDGDNELSPGTYTKDNLSVRITGNGMLRVGTIGTMFIIK